MQSIVPGQALDRETSRPVRAVQFAGPQRPSLGAGVPVGAGRGRVAAAPDAAVPACSARAGLRLPVGMADARARLSRPLAAELVSVLRAQLATDVPGCDPARHDPARRRYARYTLTACLLLLAAR